MCPAPATPTRPVFPFCSPLATRATRPRTGHPHLLHNRAHGRANKHQWLKVQLATDGIGLPAFPLGSLVQVVTEDLVQAKTLTDGIILFVQSDKRLHFGLGHARAALVNVLWSDGLRSELNITQVNCVLSVRRTAAGDHRDAQRAHVSSECFAHSRQ